MNHRSVGNLTDAVVVVDGDMENDLTVKSPTQHSQGENTERSGKWPILPTLTKPKCRSAVLQHIRLDSTNMSFYNTIVHFHNERQWEHRRGEEIQGKHNSSCGRLLDTVD